MTQINYTLILLLLIPVIGLQFGLMLAALISLIKKPFRGNEGVLWLLIILLIDIIGPILYFAIGSSKLDEQLSNQSEGR